MDGVVQVMIVVLELLVMPAVGAAMSWLIPILCVAVHPLAPVAVTV